MCNAIKSSFRLCCNIDVLSSHQAFAEVLSSNESFNASMEDTYQLLAVDPSSITSLEMYLQEYFSQIMKKLKQGEDMRCRMTVCQQSMQHAPPDAVSILFAVGASSKQTNFYL